MGIEEVLSGNKILIGKGRTGKVYKIEGNPESFAMKVFSPNHFARLWNWFFYESPHPLDTEAGQVLALHKRNLGSPLSKIIGEDVQIVDAITPSQNGFVSPFIEGRMPEKNEMQAVYAKTQELEEVFDAIGMPTLSFSRRHFGSRHKNFIIQNDQIYIVDYEQSVPVPDSRGNMGYDIIYFDDLYGFISSNRQQIINKLGTEETRNLDKAFELAKQYQAQLDIRPRGITIFAKPLSKGEIDRTVERLYKEGKISEEEFQVYKDGKTEEYIKLATMNLLVHSAIGVSTPSGIGAIFSSIARPIWTIANWGYYTMRGDDKKRIHNYRVMLASIIPIFGNGAYLLSIMEENPQIGLAINDNILREFTGKGLEETMQLIGSYRYVRPFVKGYGVISNTSFGRIQEKLLGHNTKKAHDILLGYLIEGVK